MFSLFCTSILAAGLSLTGCAKHAEGEAEGQDKTPAEPVAVQVATAGPSTLQPVLHLTGRVTLDPSKVASISAPFEGVVDSILVEEGAHIARGEPIVKMDAQLAEQDLAKATAVLAKARAAYELLKAGPRPEDIEVARQDVVARRMDLDSLKTQLAGKEKLRQKNLISPVEFDDAQRKCQAAEAALKATRAKLDLLEKGPRPQELAEAEEDLQAAVADEALAKVKLDRCTAKSPIEGNLVKVAVHPGMALAVAAPIADIVDLRQVLVEAVVPLTQLADVKIGNTAKVITAAYPDHTFEGKVVRVSYQSDPDTGNVPVWVRVDNPAELLRRDMIVRVALDGTPVAAKVVVPETAVIELDGKLIAMIVRDGKTHNTEVELGKRVDQNVEVLKGIVPGDTVITSGGYGLEEGYPVKVETSATEPAADEGQVSSDSSHHRQRPSSR